MSNITTTDQAQPLSAATLEALVVGGDLSKLNPGQRVEYYTARCVRAGLDPATQPFQYLNLQGKLTLYATKTCTDQLSNLHGIRLTILSQQTDDGIRMVTVRAEAKDGRVTEEIGALPLAGLKGDALANALMKCVTKAKRRAVLSLCGLGMMDELELETVAGAKPMYASGTTSTLVPPTQAKPVITVKATQPEPETQPQLHVNQDDAPPDIEAVDDDHVAVYGVRVPVKVFDNFGQWSKYDCVSKDKQATSKSHLRNYTWATATDGEPDGKRAASLKWVIGKAVEEQAQGKEPSLFAQRAACALYVLNQKSKSAVSAAPDEDEMDTVPF
jgi:hypothetical protein